MGNQQTWAKPQGDIVVCFLLICHYTSHYWSFLLNEANKLKGLAVTKNEEKKCRQQN